MFNRHGKLLSISHEFKPALDMLRTILDAAAFKRADCEALERRHNVGRGTLIVLDVVPGPWLFFFRSHRGRGEGDDKTPPP